MTGNIGTIWALIWTSNVPCIPDQGWLPIVRTQGYAERNTHALSQDQSGGKHTHTDKPFAKESAETKHANALTGQTENNKHNAPTGPVAKKNTHPLAGSADEKKTHTHTHEHKKIASQRISRGKRRKKRQPVPRVTFWSSRFH